jgi:hypothetical protein
MQAQRDLCSQSDFKGQGGEVYDYVIRFPENSGRPGMGSRISFKTALDTLLAAYPDSGKHYDVKKMIKERWQTRFRLAHPPRDDDTTDTKNWESLVGINAYLLSLQCSLLALDTNRTHSATM